MPVMGRFRLRRESRRAFLQSGFAVKGPVHSLAENSSAFAALCLPESIRRRSIGPLLKVLDCRFFLGHAQISSPSSSSFRASADYFRGRSFTK